MAVISDPLLNVGALTGVIWAETIIAGVAVAFRCWIRLENQKHFATDDYWVFFAFSCLVAMSALYIPTIPRMYTLYDVLEGRIEPADNFELRSSEFLKLQFAIIILFWSNIWAVKASFLAFYNPLFKNVNGYQQRAWWLVAILCGLAYFGCWVTQFMSCVPFNTYFTLRACATSQDIYVSYVSLIYSTSVDMICDLFIMLLPLSLLYGLRTNGKTKLALGLLFSAGFVIITFAGVRLYTTKPAPTANVNAKWLCLMSITESTIAVIVSCAPPFRILLTQNSKASNTHHSRHMRHSSNRLHGSADSSATAVTHHTNLKGALSLETMGKRQRSVSPGSSHHYHASRERMFCKPQLRVDHDYYGCEDV